MSKSKAKRLAEEGPRAKNKHEHWIIVENPWYRSHHRRTTRLRDDHLQDISWWLQEVFGRRRIQTVQHKPNHSCVIVTVDIDVDVAPMLGRHDWNSFLVDATTYERQEHSKIFEYAYIKQGDQSVKGWGEYIPLPTIAPHNFPVTSPYPLPAWCEVHDVPSGWALHIEPPNTAVNSEPEEPLHVISLPLHEESKLRLSLEDAGPAWEPLDPHSRVDAPISGPFYQHGSAPSSLTNDPGRLLNTPLGTQPSGDSAAFFPYQRPSHHPLTLLDDNAHAEEKKPIKREPSPIRVPYPTYFPEVDEKMKSDHSATVKAWPKMDNEEKKENESFNILIWNPYGIEFTTQEGSPVIDEAWDWLHLIADGASALYYDMEPTLTPGHNWVVAPISSRVDLRGVLGHHRWDQILLHCPPRWADNVSTIVPYPGEPESEGLHRFDSPKSKMGDNYEIKNYDKFRDPYPVPLPLPDDYEWNAPVAESSHAGSRTEDDRIKRVKL